MTLCANNMLSLLGKQVYSIQLIDYSQDTCYPATKNRKRTMRLKVGCRISTWKNNKPGKIRQKTHFWVWGAWGFFTILTVAQAAGLTTELSFNSL